MISSATKGATRLAGLALGLALLGGPALAGEAVDWTEKCPFGAESVTYTSTNSCSEYGGIIRMSLAPVTSCDFIERLPQCPRSKLPLYREFTKDEIKALKKFSKSPEYLEAAAISRFYLAYVVERHLLPDNASTQLELLLRGLWYDPDNTYLNDTYFKAFSQAMNAVTPTADAELKAFLRAAGAYGLVRRGNVSKAKEMIAAVRRSPAAKGTILPQYVDLVEKCIGRQSAPECQPDFEVEFAQ